MYVYAFFFEYTALSALNYASVFLAVIVYGLVMGKFVAANRAMETVVAA